jgi:hypothetical protein
MAYGSKKKKSPERETVEIDGERISFKKDALRKQLGLSEGEKFTKSELEKLKKIEVGDKFTFRGKSKSMTTLMKKRITFALTLMKKSKK